MFKFNSHNTWDGIIHHKYPLLTGAALVITYFIFAQLGFLIAIPPGNITPVYLPAGIAVAAIFLFGYRFWPIIFLGQLLNNLSFVWNMFGTGKVVSAFVFSVFTGLGATLQTFAVIYFLFKWCDRKKLFTESSHLIYFMGATFIGCLISSTFGATTLYSGGFLASESYLFTWITWWLGDSFGVILYAPVVILAYIDQQKVFDTNNIKEFMAIFVGLCISTVFVFINLFHVNFSLAFLPIPFVCWAAIRFRLMGASLAVLIVSTITVVGISNVTSAFIQFDLATQMLLIQAYLVVIFITGHVVGIVVENNLRIHKLLNKKVKELEIEKVKAIDSLEASEKSRDATLNLLQEVETVRKSYERTNFLLNQSGDGIFILDILTGDVLEANDSACTLFGLRRKKLIMKSVLDVDLLNMTPDEWSNIVRMVKKDQKMIIQTKEKEIDQQKFWYEVSYNFNNTDNIEKIVGVIRDVTDRRRRDRIEKEFLSIASHELRTPVAIVTGAMSNIQEGVVGTLNEDQAELMGIMEKSVNRLKGIIDDLLNLSRLETGRVTPHLKPEEIGTYLEHVVTDYKLCLPDKKIDIEMNLEVSTECVMIDSKMMIEVIYNLLSNSTRFAKSKILVTAQEVEDNPDYIRIGIGNDGPQIPKEDQDLLFLKFSRIKQPEIGDYKGTGLGLAISKEIIELHDGNIWLGDAPEFPVVFWFTVLKI